MRTNRRVGKSLAVTIKITQSVIFIVTMILLFQSSRSFSAYAEKDREDSWIYLRSNLELADSETLVELIAVGDVMLGRSTIANTQTLDQVTTWLAQADLTVGNFEGVIAPSGKDPAVLSRTLPGQPYHLVMAEKTGMLLRQAGFDLLSLGNNHALDLGKTGLSRTVDRLQSAGLQVFGIRNAAGNTNTPAIVTVKGLRIAFLGYTMIPPPVSTSGGPLPARFDPTQAAADVQAVRQQADVVVVWMHWGEEYRITPDAAQEQAAQALVQAGADVILGAHPHVIQGSQVFSGVRLEQDQGLDQTREHFVAYSLGNFVFDQYQGETSTGLALRIYLDQAGLRAVQALPVRAGTRPKLLAAEAAKPWFARINPPTHSVSFICAAQECTPAAAAPEGGEGLFWSGQVDLTGDGKPETIRRSAKQVTIEEAGQVMWSSPSEWVVLDLALGDPNNDGRYEMLLSLRKPDQQGILRSQPYIIGYRGGLYKLLWGGSALSTPISEVALGDVNGDGDQELIDLEEQPDGLKTVGVWRWHGWGFNLIWRSPSTRYVNLRLASQKPGEPLQIVVDQVR